MRVQESRKDYSRIIESGRGLQCELELRRINESRKRVSESRE